MANLAGLYRRYPEWSGQWFGTNPLAGPFPRKTADWSAEGMKAVEDGLALALADRDSAVRFQAIVGLSEVGPTVCSLGCARPSSRSLIPTTRPLLAETLGTLADPLAAPILTAILTRCRPDRVGSLGGA